MLRALRRAFPNVNSPSIKWAYKLGSLNLQEEADIFLSVLAGGRCDCCKKFKAEIEALTGIKFTISLNLRLGKLKAYRDKYGYDKW